MSTEEDSSLKKELPSPSPPETPNVRAAGLGSLSLVPDYLLLPILFRLSDNDLLNLSLVSKAMYILSGDEEMWKQRYKDKWRSEDSLHFKVIHVESGTWKMTYFLPYDSPLRFSLADRVPVTGFSSPWYSQKWYLTFVSLDHFRNCPTTIDRRSDLSFEEFKKEYAAKNRPVLIVGGNKHWPAMEKWKIDSLKREYGDSLVKCSDTNKEGKRRLVTVKDFLDYCECQTDLDPLYVFDPGYWKREPRFLEDYAIPDYFPVDYFSLVGDHPEKRRKIWRWLVIGPGRSMTKFHVDPSMTNAWNALLVGRKRWAFYPPSYMMPPGSHSRFDREDGTWDHIIPEPLQWYVENYPHLSEEQRPLECVQEPGDLLYVPSGWWHSVLNVETSVAVTHNFVDDDNVTKVWGDLTSSASSCDDTLDLMNVWKKKLEDEYPEVAQKLPSLPRRIRKRIPAENGHFPEGKENSLEGNPQIEKKEEQVPETLNKQVNPDISNQQKDDKPSLPSHLESSQAKEQTSSIGSPL